MVSGQLQAAVLFLKKEPPNEPSRRQGETQWGSLSFAVKKDHLTL
jgi:hypothetical protein